MNLLQVVIKRVNQVRVGAALQQQSPGVAHAGPFNGMLAVSATNLYGVHHGVPPASPKVEPFHIFGCMA